MHAAFSAGVDSKETVTNRLDFDPPYYAIRGSRIVASAPELRALLTSDQLVKYQAR